jgi:hypothetical protein
LLIPTFFGEEIMVRKPKMTALLILTVLLIGLPAYAQESTKPSEAEKPSSPMRGDEVDAGLSGLDETSDFKLAPVVGEKVEIQVRPGVVIKGIMKDHKYEVLENEGNYRSVDSSEVPGAGIRVYHAMGLDGFLFVRYDSLSEIKFLGKLTEKEGLELAKAIQAEMRRAEEEKKQALAEAEARRAAILAEEEARKSAAEEAGDISEATGESARTEKIRNLLKRFPPPDWRPSRLAEIKKRALILDIYPNDEESAFIDNYELWFEGYEIWQKAQAELESGN